MNPNAVFECVADTYSRLPVIVVRGKGTRLYDDKGREYLDFTSGIAVCNLGHCHEELIDVARAALDHVWHTSNLFWTRPQGLLARALCQRSFGEKVFFCNSGAESVEAAFKLMRRFGRETKGPHATEVIALEGSFHGRTLGALSLTGQPRFQKDFSPLLQTVTFVPRNDIDSLRLAIGRRTCGVILEPIQGEGGVHELDPEYLKEVRSLCHENGLLLCFDEVQVGIGRTGHLFAYQGLGVEPDLMCLAKALGNGLPIGALVGKEKYISCFQPGTHASTFGGNPVIASVAHKVVELMGEPGFLEDVRAKGERLKGGLLELKAEFPDVITEVRGRGLILAVELRHPLKGMAGMFMKQGVLVMAPYDRLLRCLPPLVITNGEIDEFLETARRIFKAWA